MEMVAAKFRTHEEAERALLKYYRRLSPAEHLEILFQLRTFNLKESDASSGTSGRLTPENP